MPIDIDQKKKVLGKNKQIEKKTDETNKKIAKEVLETVVPIKMKNLIKLKGNEIKREMKQLMKRSEVRMALILKERRTRPLITITMYGSRLNALCNIGADVSIISQDVFE